ncbi:MAG: hypothetical protein WC222_02990 [Parachlamydiales bacterium]
MFETLDNLSKGAEYALGAMACVPGANVASAAARFTVLAPMQTVGGAAGAVYHYGRSCLNEGHRAEKMEAKAYKCIEYVAHGFSNKIRAAFDLVGAGPVIFGVYDATRLLGVHNFRFVNYNKVEDYEGLNLFRKIDKIAQKLEKFLGIAACIPGVHMTAAATRFGLVGTTQVVGGVAGYLFNRGLSLFQSGDKAELLKARSFKCMEYAAHGVLNKVRAVFEFFGGGIIIFPAYDLTRMMNLHNFKVLNYNSVDSYTRHRRNDEAEFVSYPRTSADYHPVQV